MKSREPVSKCIHIIDKLDRIISVSESWLLFAQENQAGESCHPDKIINRPIWDFIDGDETQQFYEIILKNIRTEHKTVTLPFRCDAPEKRRYLELKITPIQQENIEFASSIIHEELRDAVKILELGIARSDKLIRMCSMCKKVELSENTWVEAESAVISLKLFEQSKLPQISHGLCTECFKLGMSEFEKTFT
ncbi:MAG TPA: PAS domain-containing protein [Dongiaceae bacterium]|nr:PAS domain-containing protein [Dongiaceae bacterium]